ncbi:MAG: hypothetical protein ACRD01_01455 [Terriglobales bacterium]
MATETVVPIEPLALSDGGVDEFDALEEKIQRVAEALRHSLADRDRALRERDDAMASLQRLQAAQEKTQKAHAQTEHELVGLRKERLAIRQRVQRLVQQLEGAGS